MQLAITDANIFIDLYELELIESFFQLPYRIHTTVFVLDELDTDCKEVVQKVTNILSINEEEKIELDSMNWNKGFSFPDKSILYIAKKQKMMVMSGEKKMMSWCVKNNLESHGILFILQELINTNIHNQNFIADKLTELMSFNQWLPTETCIALIEKWEK